MDNRQPPAFRASNMPYAAHSVPEQLRIILPPIIDLRLPATEAINAQTQTQSGPFHAKYSEKIPKHRYHKPYSRDQIHFIQCKRDIENMTWMTVTEEYNRAFPGYHRSQSGLEARYYRDVAEKKYKGVEE